MTSFIQIIAAGFVTGIAVAGRSDIPFDLFFPLLASGIVILIVFIAGLLAQKRIFSLLFISAMLLGGADAVYHLDETRPGHLAGFLKEEDIAGASVEGWVCAAPDNRERYTILPVQAERIKTFEGAVHRVRFGKLYLRVYPSVGDVYGGLAYGDRVRITDTLFQIPSGASNPGAFDMKRFLRNQHYYGTASIRRNDQITVIDRRLGNPLVHLSSAIKMHMLEVIKKTVPYPESSFLGGVLLGLRSGLSFETKEMFRAAGVSHVLAVSGLHVTIITLFFTGLLALMPIPRSARFITILIVLLLFTLITGARPSAIRAAIMNAVTLLFYYYQGIRLDRSFLLGISIAAVAILIFQPLVLSEPSFLFSFAAVLSLAILTRPFFNLGCRYLRGILPFLLLISVFLLLTVLLIDPGLLIRHWPYIPLLLIVLLTAFYIDHLKPDLLTFRQLPRWFTLFTAAQVGIQLGMFPLTAYYFKKVSITAAFANFICIPLIGLIVQLGLLAGILGAVPWIGSALALVLNAANYLAIKFFLSTAQFFGSGFPYPDVAPPRMPFIIIYYGILLMIAFYPWIRTEISPRFRWLKAHWKQPGVMIRVTALLLLLLIPSVRWLERKISSARQTLVYFFDPTIFNMGGGNAALVVTPGGYHLLTGAGPSHVLKRQEDILLDVGTRVITPALLDLHCRRLDGLVLTAPCLADISGMLSIAGNPYFSIGAVFHSLPLDELPREATPEQVLESLKDPALFDESHLQENLLMARSLLSLIKTAEARNIPLIEVRSGSLIHDETLPSESPQRRVVIQVINPPETRFAGRYSSGSNSIVMKITDSGKSILLCSQIDQKAQRVLAEGDPVSSVVMQVPANGQSYAVNQDFIHSVDPGLAVMSPLLSVWNRRGFDQTQWTFEEEGIEVFRTDRDGCVLVRTDGRHWLASSYLTGRKAEIPP